MLLKKIKEQGSEENTRDRMVHRREVYIKGRQWEINRSSPGYPEKWVAQAGRKEGKQCYGKEDGDIIHCKLSCNS